MTPFPYPTAEKQLTPKMVRDALKGLVWPKLRWWDCNDDQLRGKLETRKQHFRSMTIAQVAEPVTWALVCAIWNSRRMESARAMFDASMPASSGTRSALEALATAIVLQTSSSESPLARLNRFFGLVGVERTPEQEAAYQRERARENATLSAANAIIASACRVGEQVVFDHKALLGTLLTHKAEYVRLRVGSAVATVQRIRLDTVAEVLVSKSSITAALAPMPHKPGQWALSIRWVNASGTTGGLDFHSIDLDTVHDSWCTVVEFPESLRACSDACCGVSACPEWATPEYIKAAMARQEAARKSKPTVSEAYERALRDHVANKQAA